MIGTTMRKNIKNKKKMLATTKNKKKMSQRRRTVLPTFSITLKMTTMKVSQNMKLHNTIVWRASV